MKRDDQKSKSSTETKCFKIPKYEIKNIILDELKGWIVQIRTKRKVNYRIVSGLEQVNESESGYLYLSVIINGYKNIGFRFSSLNHRVFNFKDENGCFCICILKLEGERDGML